jgi:hypothetical protein
MRSTYRSEWVVVVVVVLMDSEGTGQDGQNQSQLGHLLPHLLRLHDASPRFLFFGLLLERPGRVHKNRVTSGLQIEMGA